MAIGVDGFIVVDLPPEEGSTLVTKATSRGDHDTLIDY